MGWPTLIQLHNSEYSHSYDGSEIRETWYIEPYDSITAFVAAMLGRVDADGKNPVRTLPASHFLYPWCLATACETVPFDKLSFSYMGATNLDPIKPDAQANLTQNLQRVTTATGTYKGQSKALDPTADIPFVSLDNASYSAGAFVCVTYLPLLIPQGGTFAGVLPQDMDTVNWRFEPQIRTNTINSGLKLVTPPNPLNFGGSNLLYPDAGIAPVLKEEYQELIVERRMLLPTMNLPAVSQYINAVNFGFESLIGPDGNAAYEFAPQTLRFSKFATEFVQVPTVDNSGEPNGYNRWLNMVYRYDWRTTRSRIVHGDDGLLIDITANVTWNHVLAYPGTLNWIINTIGGQNSGLGWYRAKFSAQALGVDADAFPTARDAVGPGANIFDPITKNF